MKKNKKNKADKKPLFSRTAKSIRKLRKNAVNSIGGLSTAQKVVGGATLVALGLSYLAKRRNNSATDASTTGAEESLAAMEANAA